ncbi:hypothetical protein O6H91_12G070600 [Diphasiastrum complanatum]|uniref:Uncharacterized protein n=1 Tax=Diphasiastrum complanatum TaxID=34168 RepID=A0ACC2C4B0_DIPCM|nr:hypothetical protein O6H91_12G070600 [Diphasiastrum complanatum]
MKLSTTAAFSGQMGCCSLLKASTIFLGMIGLLNVPIMADFISEFDVTWSKDHVNVLNGGNSLQLKLDQASGSGFASKSSYLFGDIRMDIKLVPGDSAGTVTAYYFSSQSANRDELDFEFLGNVSGQPYVLQTNVFANGQGGREERIFLWFDPTAAFHTYSVLWTRNHIMFSVDSIPIRVFANNKALGVAYPSSQPMNVFSSIWNGDSWATRGGLEKINWNYAPFVASYQNFQADACVSSQSDPNQSCTASSKWGQSTTFQSLSSDQASRLKAVRQNYMVYDYCKDTQRYPTAPPECSHEA